MINLNQVCSKLNAKILLGEDQMDREVFSACGAIVFVRGKLPGKEIVEAAKANDIPLLVTCYTLFEACGRLYEMGIKGCPHKVFADE